MAFKVLFSTIVRPLTNEETHSLAPSTEFVHWNLTSAQGHYGIRGVNPNLGIHFLAENIRTPAVVLENPSMREYLREVATGGYTHVCLSFLPAAFELAKEQCERTRLEAPNVEIIAIGAGAAIPDCAAFVDYQCSGNGVSFLRDLLGEGIGAPLVHPWVIYQAKDTLGLSKTGNSAIIVTGNGNKKEDSTAVSPHFFDCYARPNNLSGKEIYDILLTAMERMTPASRTGAFEFFFVEDDFLHDCDRIRELAECISASDSLVLFNCFTTPESLRDYDVEELISLGVDTLWLNIPEEIDESLGGLFADLHSAGIQTVATSYIGRENQDEMVIRTFIEQQLALKATFNQFLLALPKPGSKTFERYEQQGRLLHNSWEEFDGWHFPIEHEFLAPEDAEYLQQYACHRDLEELGPSILRAVDVALKGWERWRNSEDESCLRRANAFLHYVDSAAPIFPAAKTVAPTKTIRNWVENLESRVKEETGRLTLPEYLHSNFLRLKFLFGDFWRNLTGTVAANKVSMRRAVLRSLKYELKLVSLQEDLLDAIQPYVEQWNEFTANHLDSIGFQMDKLNELKRTGASQIGEYIEQLQHVREKGIECLNSEPFALLQTDAVARLNSHIEHLRQLRHEGYEKLNLHVEYLTALRDETKDSLQALADQMESLKEQGVEKVQPYIEQLEAVRQNGVETVQTYLEKVSELREQGLEAVTVEIRGFMSSRDFKALREKIEPLVSAGRPIILYASHHAPIDSKEFEWVARKIRKMFSENAVLPIVGGVCQQLAVAEPLRIIS